jgi:hypothetical protein
MVDWATTALYLALALTVIGWFYVDVRERRLARDTAIHQQKAKLFQDLDVVVRGLTDAISTLEFVRTLDLEKKDERASSVLKLVGTPFMLGSRDAVYAVLDELQEWDEPKSEKQFKEAAEGIRSVVFLEVLVSLTELYRAFQEILSRLEYVEYGASVKSKIERLVAELSELQSMSGAAYWYESIGLKGLIQPPKLEEWAPKVGKSIEELKNAMKADLTQTL